MKKYILFYFLFIVCFNAFSNAGVKIRSEKNYISIDTLGNSFLKKSIIRGYHVKDKYIHTFYYGELDRITSANAYIIESNKKNKISKQQHFSSRVLTDNFYAGLSSYNFQLEQKKNGFKFQEFQIEIEQTSEQIIRLASIHFFKNDDESIDSILYEIKVPISYSFHYSREDVEQIRNLKIDSSIDIGYITYKFEKTFGKSELVDSSYYKSIRSIVCKRESNPYAFMNQWYWDMLHQEKLSDNYERVCDSITVNLKDSNLIIKNIYDYVRKNIRYIDIENGINAFKPRSCDEVIHNKFGDCKDMAFLIHKMLEYKGISSYVALSSTSSHQYQFNFPSIASADHLICIAMNKGRMIYLDATEKYGIFPLPSMQILNTSAFLIDEKTFKIIHIPKNNPTSSKIKRDYKFLISPSGVRGTSKIYCTGYNKIELESIIAYTSKSQLNKTLEIYCNQKGFNTKYENFKIESTDTSILIICDVLLKGNALTEIQNKYYLDLSFLPNPFPNIGNLDSTKRDINLIFNKSYETKVLLEFDKELVNINSPFKNFQIKTDDINYLFNISTNKNLLKVEYSLNTYKTKYKKEEFKNFKENSNKIATTLNHEISIN